MPTNLPISTTYSFRDLSGVLNNPLLDAPYQIVGGNIGNGQMIVRMLTQRTEHEVAADGTVMPSYIAGANGELSIEVQQTSALHHQLLDLYNLLVTAADGNNDISNWAATTISLRALYDGSGHYMAGVSFQKIPDKPYAAKGQNITWVLMCALVTNQ
jgi:hypothetical protein